MMIDSVRASPPQGGRSARSRRARRRLARISRAGAVWLLAAGCDAVEHVPPAAGRYAFVASHPLPGGAPGDSIHVEGVLALSDATRGELEGHWEVDRYGRELGRGEWVEEDSAYVVYAFPTYGGTAVHHIRPAADGEGLTCEGHFTAVLKEGEVNVPLRCLLVPGNAVPGTIATPDPGAPKIRPIDRDSVPAAADSGAFPHEPPG